MTVPVLSRGSMNRFKTSYGRCCGWIVFLTANAASHAISRAADALRGSEMRGFKSLLYTTILLAPLALVPATGAQVAINIGVQPVCSYGYYDYSPYACAPVGFYGPGYFYNGIFLGMGPWAGWGYSHGWGNHRFSNGGGGRYTGGFHGVAANHARGGGASAVRINNGGSRGHVSAGSSHVAQSRNTSRGASHTAPAHVGGSHGTSHASASHGSGSHSNGGSHGGGGGHR